MPCQIVIVDCGMGNLNSVARKLANLNCTSRVSSNPNDLVNADKIILPGVGHFLNAMENLTRLHLVDALNEMVVVQRKPILGICLGMQLLAKRSEEGNADGLGWIDAQVVRFQTANKLKFKIPHVGWNQIAISKDSPLMRDIPENAEFYFAHSYYLQPKTASDILNETEYEYKFTSAVEKCNIFGVQYHPEKSHDCGEQLLSNFVGI